MDKISLVGLTLGIAAILVGQVIEGGHLSSLFQPTAFMIVIGGTLGAVMLQSPLRVFMQGMRMARWVFVPPAPAFDTIIEQVANWGQTARKEGLLSLENQIEALSDPFMRKGLQLLVDGIEPNRLREVLEVEIGVWENQMKMSARIWEAAGGYAPTIGILGAVMGLIHVMENLSDPSRLGAGIAVAFVATIYGVGFANLVFLPIAKKLGAHIVTLTTQREMFVDGLVGIANGDNPRIIASRMQGYVA
ncbi:MAG TPA: flagellar motor protein [Thauera aminoaromatica]|jgi:chemotaxis protein MotA|uniref:Flagellar motor protein n=2 Tax=Thauera aminoaromatica TaxID=164330 RepID=C4KAV6_THASP|nr:MULTISPECIES: flagellar motor protein [Thauera]MBL8462551.1 flagellar motor protein [Thauera sp.]MDA0235435.1 flagellar motor protein [Pseudomonadota bacterium]ACR01532.1 MotA/TolQ/ExbB proton channel [Thauera aminoaromatica]ENO85983.1 flagellar motor protein [Thauera aminoaromatica S2]KIN88284.1 motA/TolQ/ExbB proton channel family protein [Thauera sp. SWB20]